MSLPAPTVSGIDVNAERLKDVERRRAAPAPNIAGAVRDAVTVTNAVTEMSEAEKARQQAQWFQKEYVDKGWEGYEKLWQESGAPPAADPKIVRQSIGDSPVAAFKYLGELGEKVKAKAATEAYNKTLTGDDAAAAAAGVKPETIYTEKNKRATVADKTASAEKIAGIRKAATLAAKGAAEALANAKDAGVIAAIEKETARQTDINADIDATEADPDMTEGAKRRKIDQLTRDLSASSSRVSGYLTRVKDVAKADSIIDAGKNDPPPPPEGATVWRLGPDGKTMFEYNSKTKQPTGKSRPK